MAIGFDRVNRWVIPDTDIVTIQELYNAITDYQDEPGNMDLEFIASASGKDDLGGGVSTGITMTMNPVAGWTIRWEPRTATSPEFILRRVTGGNLAEVNGTLPITPSDGNTVVVQSSSSATIQNLEDLQFGGEVWIDTVDGTPGTAFPQGFETDPVDNLTDAVIIATNRKARRYRLRASKALPLTLTGSLQNTQWTGFGGDPDVILSLSIMEMSFIAISIISGDAQLNVSPINGSPNFSQCQFGDESGTTISNFYGDIYEGTFKNVTLALVPGSSTNIADGQSGRAGSLPGLTIDFQSAGSTSCGLRNYSGGVQIENMAAGDVMSIEGVTKLTLGASCTGGSINLRGVGEPVVDNSGGAVTINDLGYLTGQAQQLIEAILRNKTITDPVTGVMTVYEADGTTVKLTANIYEDAAAVTPYQGQGAERRERLT